MPKKKIILIDLILIILTGGLWNLWMQYRQIRDYNNLIGENRYSFIFWLFFSLLTLGLYHVYHEYKLTRDICLLEGNIKDPEIYAILAGVISITGLWIFVDLYQQEIINRSIKG